MPHFLKLAWAVAERLIPRASSAIVLVLLGLFSTPATLGVYSLGILGYSLVQAVSDGALRQVLPQALPAGNGREFIRRYRLASSVGGFFLINGYVLILVGLVEPSLRTQALQLLPLALAPSLSAWGVVAIGHLQLAGRWSVLARTQLVASIVSTTVGVVTVVLTHSVLGGVLAVISSEATLAAVNRWSTRSIKIAAPENEGSPFSARDFFTMFRYSGLAWIQGQSDRLLIGFVTGAAGLGVYSLAVAASRTAGEAAASATANVLRSRPDRGESFRSNASRDAILAKGLLLATAAAATSVLIVELALIPVLSAEWDALVTIVPILAISSIPSVLNWTAAALHLENGTSRRAAIAPAVGIGFSILIAAGALFGFELAAWFVLLRELAFTSTTYALLGRRAPWRIFVWMLLAVSVVAAIVAAVPWQDLAA